MSFAKLLQHVPHDGRVLVLLVCFLADSASKALSQQDLSPTANSFI